MGDMNFTVEKGGGRAGMDLWFSDRTIYSGRICRLKTKFRDVHDRRTKVRGKRKIIRETIAL